MVVPIFVFFFVKYNLWVSIYQINNTETIKGYSLQKMIQYQFYVFLFMFFVRSHFFSQTLARDIRLGKISSFLLYPFNFIGYQFSLFVSDKLIQLVIGIMAFSIATYFGFASIESAQTILYFAMFLVAVNVFWFFIQTLIGLLAFWLDETWSINVCARFVSAFLAGDFIPLDLYPETLRSILFWTPFPYLTYFPVKIMMGDIKPSAFGLVIIAFWLVCLMLLTQWAWKKGLKRYSGAGI